MKKSILLLLALTLCLVLTACSGSTETETAELYNLALVAGIVNNNTVVNTSIDELTQLSSLSDSTYAFIEADGSPSVIAEGTIPDYTAQGYSKKMLQRLQASNAADLTAQLEAAEPDAAETDLAAALTLAVRGLRATEDEGRENLLVLYHSGLSTTGLIDMVSTPVYQMDVESSVETVASSLDLDLSNISIIWYCCGDVAGDQPALTDGEVTTLKNFYETLFLELGAENITFMADLPQSGSYSFEQEVSVMETEGTSSGLQAKVVNYEDVGEEEVETLFQDGDILSFEETTIAFLPDSTELADSSAALAALEVVIDYMTANSDFEVLICGTTTSAGERDSCITFSEGRAKAIRSLLVSEGVEEDRIYILGCGYSSSLYVYDRTEDGTLDEEIAPQNRSVKLVDNNSDTAAEIRSSLSQ
ncbi:MAG: OmpA family protein [Clostridiales bacterium]|nr:OmpA family protein [Clostridiales bacterium]